jgi:glycosyltransferase involved in cell wall biosynthesis
MNGRDIVCFANEWTADPTSKHHLMRNLAERNRVLWIDSPGMRRPSLLSRADLGRLVAKARSFLVPATQQLPGLWSCSPPSIPLPGSTWASRVNAGLYRRTITRELKRIGMDGRPVLYVFGPNAAPWIRGLPRHRLVYHCVDRWGAFERYDAAWIEACERELCRRADIVFASATDLVEHCRGYGAEVTYVPHGVDHAHFARALEPGPLPPELDRIAGPRIGFFGLIHEWVDTDLIAALADRLPYSFVLLGASNQDLSALIARSNVHALGRRPYTELPDWCRGFHAAIVPFRVSELTLSVNPIKLREYAAAGIPVVATGLPEIRRCSDIAVCPDGVDEWVAALRAAVERGQDLDERRRQSARVRDQDWSGVAERVGALIEASPQRSDGPGRR